MLNNRNGKINQKLFMEKFDMPVYRNLRTLETIGTLNI